MNEDVLGFDITMAYSAIVKLVQCLAKASHKLERLKSFLSQGGRPFARFLQVVVKISFRHRFHNDVEVLLVFVIFNDTDDM